MNDHHRKDGKWFKDKEPIDSVTKTEANEPSRFSSGDSFIIHRAYIAGRLKNTTTHKRNLVFVHQGGLIWSCRTVFFSRNPHREIYNLGMVSGPVLLNIKGKCWMSKLLGDRTENNENN